MKPLHAFLAGAALVAVAWVTSGLLTTSAANAEAERWESAANLAAEEREALRIINVADSLAYADSSAVWAARTDSARAREARATAGAADARRRGAAIAADLAVLLEGDSMETAMLQAHLAEDDSIDALTDRALEAKDEQIATVTADRDDLARQLLGVRTELAAAIEENVYLRGALEAERALREQIERESRPSFLERAADVGEKALAAKELFDQVVPS